MKKIFLCLIMMASVMLVFSTSARAAGIGGYGFFSYTDLYLEDYDTNSDNYCFGGGFVFDTNLSQDRLFNYRLNVGLGWVAIQPDSKYDDLVDAPGGVAFEIINTFGFGIVRTSTLRLWLGPQIGFRYVNIDTQIQGNAYYGESDFDIDRYIFICGAVVGLNINLEQNFTIGVDGGFRFNSGITYGRFVSDYDYYETDAYTTYGPEGYFNVSFMFRFNE